MRFFMPEGTAIDEIKGRVEVLQRDWKQSRDTARRLRNEAREAEADAEAILRRIQEYTDLLAGE